VFDDGDIEEELGSERDAYWSLVEMPELGDDDDSGDESESEAGAEDGRYLALTYEADLIYVQTKTKATKLPVANARDDQRQNLVTKTMTAIPMKELPVSVGKATRLLQFHLLQPRDREDEAS
jgi:hypothetical protein